MEYENIGFEGPILDLARCPSLGVDLITLLLDSVFVKPSAALVILKIVADLV